MQNILILDPLDQFEISNILNLTLLENSLNINITNMVLYLVIAFTIMTTLNILTNNFKNIIFNS